MAAGDNVCMPLYEPGERVTGFCTAGVVGKTFADISGDLQSPLLGLSATSEGGNIQVATAASGARAVGVFVYDQISGQKVPLIMLGSGMIIPVTSGAAVTAGVEVQVGTAGKAITLAAGKSMGKALSTVAGADLDLLVLIA